MKVLADQILSRYGRPKMTAVSKSRLLFGVQL
jgi:hypothetical protein